MKKYLPLAFLLIFVSAIILVGCARITESGRILLGTSTRALEETKDKTGLSQSFNLDYPTCYDKVINLLRIKKAYIFLHSPAKHRIVALNLKGENDTTEVGIFFEEIKPQETKIILTSLSPTYLKLASEIIFEGLNLPKPKTKEEEQWE